MWTAVGAFSDPPPVEGETKSWVENSEWQTSQKSKSAHTEHSHLAPTIGHIWHPSQTALLRKWRITNQIFSNPNYPRTKISTQLEH